MLATRTAEIRLSQSGFTATAIITVTYTDGRPVRQYRRVFRDREYAHDRAKRWADVEIAHYNDPTATTNDTVKAITRCREVWDGNVLQTGPLNPPPPVYGLKDHQIAKLVSDVTRYLHTSPAMPKLPESLRSQISNAINQSLLSQKLKLDG